MMTLLLILASNEEFKVNLHAEYNTLDTVTNLIDTLPGDPGNIVAIEILKVELV